MENKTVEVFKNVYENDLQLLNNRVCNNCDALIKHPIMPWIVGANYFKTEEKVLFIGKPHRGTPGKELPSGILDPRTPHLDWLMECSWPYWSYTKAILRSLYGDVDPWNYCSFANIIKCTNVDGEGNPANDETTFDMAKCCITDLGVIFKEVEILKPQHIVFYTYSLYRNLLIDLPFANSITEVTNQNYKIKCGQKQLGWWSRIANTSWSNDVKILVTGHPERKKKEHFVSLLSDWIKMS